MFSEGASSVGWMNADETSECLPRKIYLHSEFRAGEENSIGILNGCKGIYRFIVASCLIIQEYTFKDLSGRVW